MINLIRTQLWVSLGLNNIINRKKRGKTLLFAGLLVLALSPSYSLIITMLNHAFRFLYDNNLPLNDMLLTGIYSLTQILTLLLGIPIVYSTLVQKNDLSILLPLPYKPAQILIAKLSSVYIFELIACLLLFLPAFIMNIIYFHPGIMTILNGIVSLLLLPMIPLVICTLLALAIVNIPFIGKSKWLWTILIMSAVIGVSTSFTMLTANSAIQTGVVDFVKIKMEQMNQSARYIPGSIFGMKALAISGLPALWNQILNLAVTGAYLLALFFAGRWLYLGPIFRGDAVVSRNGHKQEKTLERSFIAAYIRKEMATTFKDPSVAMNAVGGYISLPIVLIMWTIMKVQSKGKIDIVGEFTKTLQNPGIRENLPIMIAGIAIFLALLSVGSSLFSACYSKDGKRLWIEKTIPVHPFEIMKGKLYMGLIVVSSLNMIAVVMATYIMKLSLWQSVYVFVLSEIVIVYNSLIGLMVDCTRPKLEWKEIIQAVKQNMNVILSMLISTITTVMNWGILYLFWKNKVDSFSVYGIMFGFNVILLIISWLAARKVALRLDSVQV
ncbi:MAG: ABC-2 family transporter permease [Armatimonadota bacterium]